MKSARDALRQNKEFYDDIKILYKEVRSGAEKSRLLESDQSKDLISIALTSNRRFYGTQNIDIVKEFLEDISRKKTDAMVIGLTGQTYLRGVEANKPIEMMLFKDDYPSAKEVYRLLDKVKQYRKVLLYHPFYVNLMTQRPTSTDITYTPSEEEIKETAKKSYIFEPELKQILNFFETHVRFLLFRRSLLEVELARTSARLVAMVGAEERSDKLIYKKKLELNKARKSLINARLLETVSGAKRWSKV